MNSSLSHRSLKLLLFIAAFLLISSFSVLARQEGLLSGSHGNASVMAKSCRACHRGMTMALSGEESACLSCHGDAIARQSMIQNGYLSLDGGGSLYDVASDLRKPYNHPVLTIQGVHRQQERLPEEVANAARHSECVDCHDPHLSEKNNPFRGLKGRRVGNLITDIENEYELCYRCHSESANMPGGFSDKHGEFKASNPSFHPVEEEGKNTNVVSLKDPYVAQKEKPNQVSRISCSDCHGSDDPNGAKGPHGSNNKGLLSLNYQQEDGSLESEQAYSLCYKCHSRASILSDESFAYHSLHIQGRMGSLGGGTSCFTCHDAHGSSQYPHLIKFNQDVVFENALGDLNYKAQGFTARHGSCSLNCHGVEHVDQEY